MGCVSQPSSPTVLLSVSLCLSLSVPLSSRRHPASAALCPRAGPLSESVKVDHLVGLRVKVSSLNTQPLELSLCLLGQTERMSLSSAGADWRLGQ